jgi:antitoxin (DNA-binding transcriptional repressor) of toxin-antitoxin stability system
MVHDRELSADDPDALVEAVRRAAAGERVHLVDADGRRVADVVPPAADTPAPARGLFRRPAETDIEYGDRVFRAFLAATGGAAPRLEHYRRVYATLGLPWPGDDDVRSLYQVDDS